MIRHWLIDTQEASGFSLRNGASVLGGQIAYLSPLVAWLAALTLPRVWRDRPTSAVGTLLFWSCALPLAALLPLALWSRVAEPHWLAPAWIALAPAAARAPESARAASPTEPRGGPGGRALVGSACAIAGAIVAAAHLWVLVPGLLRFAPTSYDPRLDIANELFGWEKAIEAVRDEANREWVPGADRGDVVVVGPHWVVCAQLEAGLFQRWPVGCNTPIRDDFDDWFPRAEWRAAETIVWVSDTRFGPPPDFGLHAIVRERKVPVYRAGRMVREFTLTVLARRAVARGPVGDAAKGPGPRTYQTELGVAAKHSRRGQLVVAGLGAVAL
jgi:hypothetical protein